MTTWWLLPMAFAASFVLTGMLRHYLSEWGIVDVPNSRSSHIRATPRGGGLAIVVVFLGFLSLLWAADALPSTFFAAASGASVLVALIGAIDDGHHVAAPWRLTVHSVAAGWALWWLGGMPHITIAGWDVGGLWFEVFGLVFIVWAINLYNFMDGINGLASIEAITVCFGAILLGLDSEPATAISVVAALLLVCVLGFLCWNFPRARVFMGDAGSGFLGLILAILAIQDGRVSSSHFFAWLILLGVFVVDATVTLIRRMARRHKLHVAHRSHAYQHASRLVGNHAIVTSAVGLINLLWLCPIALLVGNDAIVGWQGVLLAYSPLLALSYWLGAGVEEAQA
jgi:Fuc2NAc and GlcNAc transferase